MPLPPQVQELIDSSGNSFHARVAQWFVANGWSVAVSPYYMDQTQQKAREIDLVVERLWTGSGHYGDGPGALVTRLFVECKYIAAPAVFWFTDKSASRIEQKLCEVGPFRANNSYTAKHHYLAAGNRVAKLFASANARGQDSEPIYKALNQALNGLVSLRDHDPHVLEGDPRPRNYIKVFNYPVVLCSSFGQIFSADFDGVHEPGPMRDNFQLEVQYAFFDRGGRPQDELFILDFVEFDKLPAFASAIESDAKAARFMLAPN